MMMNSKLPRELRSKVVNELVDHNDPPFNPRHNSGDIYGWRYQQYHRNPDFLSLREVSRDWNETLEADAHLWTNIQISSDRDLVVAKSAIQRSAHRPLSIFIGMKHGVSVYVDEPWIEDTIQFIATCIHRCVRLTLHLHWQKIAMALQYWSNIPAPCLRLLYLRDSLDKEDAISGGYRDLNIRGSTIKRLPNLFAGYMPLLEVVALDYVNINWDPMPFVTPKVSNFTLWLPEGTTGLNGRQFQKILMGLPEVAKLVVRAKGPEFMLNELFNLPKLDYIELRDFRSFYLNPQLNMRYPRITTLVLNGPIHINGSPDGLLDLLSVLPNLRTLELAMSNFTADPNFHLPPLQRRGALEQLTCLSITSSNFIPFRILAAFSFPSLRQTFIKYKTSRREAIFIDPSLSEIFGSMDLLPCLTILQLHVPSDARDVVKLLHLAPNLKTLETMGLANYRDLFQVLAHSSGSKKMGVVVPNLRRFRSTLAMADKEYPHWHQALVMARNDLFARGICAPLKVSTLKKRKYGSGELFQSDVESDSENRHYY